MSRIPFCRLSIVVFTFLVFAISAATFNFGPAAASFGPARTGGAIDKVVQPFNQPTPLPGSEKTGQPASGKRNSPTQTATTFTVTRGDDRNSTCVSGADCSLREAINSANSTLGADVIDFAPGLGTITLTSGITISGVTTITGPGANLLTIDGGPGSNRIFFINVTTVTITDVTLTGGEGGGTAPAFFGGAIYSKGSSFVTLDRVNVSGNSAQQGGGIYFESGTNTIRNSTISFNSTNVGSGGGVYSGLGNLTVVNSTFAGNNAANSGGGLSTSGNVKLRNVTITGNSAGKGGGIVCDVGAFDFANTIVAGNAASINYPEIGFNIFGSGGSATSLGNNLVGDTAGDAANTGTGFAYQGSDILDQLPTLDDLQYNGGPTPTIALLGGSPAINNGNNALAIDPSNGNAALTTDQRGTGFSRIVSGTVDIGAYESTPVANVDVTAPGDAIVGVAAVAGANTSILAVVGTNPGVNNYPAAQSPDKAIDNTVATKYLNFQNTGTGLIVSPVTGPQTVVRSLRFTTAEDAPERDPLTVTLEGTNDSSATSTLNSSWTLLYSGPSGLASDPGRNVVGPQVTVGNAQPFRSYRLLVTSVRNPGTANSMQFAEAELIGSTPTHTFTVNDLGDTVDASAGDGTCADLNGKCTLRAAIDETQGLVTGPFIINFSVTGTINLSSVSVDGGSALFLNTDTAIVGPGANLLTIQRSTVGGTPQMRVISFAPFRTQSISGVTIANGSLVTGDTGGGGGIITQGTVTVSGCAIINNHAGNGNTFQSGGAGGGIRNLGTLTVANSTISGNSSGNGGNGNAGTGAGLGGFGGGIENSGTMTLRNSTVSGNQTGTGGTSSFLAGRGGDGGGIAASGPITITNSTVSVNKTGAGGAANFFGRGGGITRSTLTTITIGDTIVAGNSSGGASGPDVFDTYISQGYNLIGIIDGSNGFNQPTDLTGTGAAPLNAVLGVLGDNGGPTKTHRLLPGSPAIDHGNAGGQSTDQRGQARPFDDPAIAPAAGGDNSDIGAFEVQAVLQTGNPSFIVNTTDDPGDGDCTPAHCTLREAIIAANGDPNTDTITFAIPGGVPQTIQLTTALPALATNLNINNTSGQGITVRGEGAADPYRIFLINSGTTVNISNLTIANGYLNGLDSSYGAGIANLGTLALTNCTVSGNTLVSNVGGAGLLNGVGGTLTVTSSTISGNSSTPITGFFTGGGGGILNAGTLNVTNSTISGNYSQDGGGGIANQTGMTLVGVTITNNSCSVAGCGGGIISQSGGSNALNNTIVAGNFRTGSLTADDVVLDSVTPGSSFNLIGTGNLSPFVNGVNNNQVDVANPGLGPLADNGGPTMTHAITSVASPAVDKGKNFGPSATDQRGSGFVRTVDLPPSNASGGDGTDIGAYELQSGSAAGVSVSGRVLTADGRGLRNAIVKITNSLGVVRTVRTGNFGTYRFEDVESGQTYIIGVSSKRYRFTPRVLIVMDQLSDVDFVGS